MCQLIQTKRQDRGADSKKLLVNLERALEKAVKSWCPDVRSMSTKVMQFAVN